MKEKSKSWKEIETRRNDEKWEKKMARKIFIRYIYKKNLYLIRSILIGFAILGSLFIYYQFKEYQKDLYFQLMSNVFYYESEITTDLLSLFED
ncbi:MAG: hypothetical protein NZ853_00855 [Leptospiraceae bacterium]|nr:hypothetical protein [Leptospiraceae bacterium]MDW7976222.1 hypothetical protein [Leptospiraceae bacterium]